MNLYLLASLIISTQQIWLLKMNLYLVLYILSTLFLAILTFTQSSKCKTDLGLKIDFSISDRFKLNLNLENLKFQFFFNLFSLQISKRKILVKRPHKEYSAPFDSFRFSGTPLEAVHQLMSAYIIYSGMDNGPLSQRVSAIYAIE